MFSRLVILLAFRFGFVNFDLGFCLLDIFCVLLGVCSGLFCLSVLVVQCLGVLVCCDLVLLEVELAFCDLFS